MHVVAVIQARMGSTRLPGKVMKKLVGKTVLAHVIERVKACLLVDKVVVATTTAKHDDAIVAESEQHGAMIFRGDEEDVLARYFGAAKKYEADVVVRVTSDCPLFDPQVLTAMLEEFVQAKQQGRRLDYLGNSLRPTFPLGLGAEVFTFSSLAQAFYEATKDYEREHVTPYIYLHPEKFKFENFTNDVDLSSHRWTLDTKEDFDVISKIYNQIYSGGTLFSTDEVLLFLEKYPEISSINSHVKQKTLGE